MRARAICSMMALPDLVRHALALLEVRPCAESGAGAGDDQAPGGAGVDVEVGEAGPQLLHHAGIESIARRRPVEGDRADAIVADVDLDRLVGHATLSVAPAAAPPSGRVARVRTIPAV